MEQDNQIIENTPEYKELQTIEDKSQLPDQTDQTDWILPVKKPNPNLFKEGNKMWNLRTKSGVSKLFNSPEHFLTESLKYFEWASNNPWLKQEQLKTPPRAAKDDDGNVYFPPNIVEIPTQRPFTIEGLCNYLGITYETFLNYEKKESYSDFFSVLAYVRKLIENQQLEGGMVGAFNPAIVIRKLGLKEQIESKVDQTYTSIVFQTRSVEDVQAQDVTDQENPALDTL
jgi:hypothetical protein